MVQLKAVRTLFLISDRIVRSTEKKMQYFDFCFQFILIIDGKGVEFYTLHLHIVHIFVYYFYHISYIPLKISKNTQKFFIDDR